MLSELHRREAEDHHEQHPGQRRGVALAVVRERLLVQRQHRGQSRVVRAARRWPRENPHDVEELERKNRRGDGTKKTLPGVTRGYWTMD